MRSSGEAYGAASALMVIGGHSIAGAIINGEVKRAIFEALGVAACALIFGVLGILVKSLRDRSE